MIKKYTLRLRKILFMVIRPHCWRALALGVAPPIEHMRILRGLRCDLVLDVGANRGQFSFMSRLLYPQVPIHAYEPLGSEAQVFRKVHGGCPWVTLHEIALGEQTGTAELHVSGRADSSSLLPIGELQARFFPSTEEVGTQTVEVKRLDDLREHWAPARSALLKLDVQGFELNVLRGAVATLRSCAYVYAECSEVSLYEGQALRVEVSSFLAEQGFKQKGSCNSQWHDGNLIQADYLFAKE
jgi:FkbM family methyltransferase